MAAKHQLPPPTGVKGVFYFMRRAILFANGEMNVTPTILNHIQSSDMIIAADGGSQHCKALGIQPDVIIGDLDSLDPGEIFAYESARVELIRYPAHKDETDLELALIYVISHEFDDLTLIGALGARWDMTLANMLLIAHPMFRDLNIRILDGSQELFLIGEDQPRVIEASPGDLISLIPIHGDAHGIVTRGLEYPLNYEALLFGSPRGVSNVFIEDHAEISVKKGVLLCVVDRASQVTQP
jgi:thiamine pyrophosphokinase